MFRAVWKVAKNFVDPITVKKFKLVGDVPLADMKKAGIPWNRYRNIWVEKVMIRLDITTSSTYPLHLVLR